MDYIAIIHKEGDSDYGVSFPDFPGCVTAGTSLQDAKDMALDALSGHVEILRENGVDIPAASSLDDIMKDPDYDDAAAAFVVSLPQRDTKVRFNVSAMESQLAEIDRLAREAGLTRSAYMVSSSLDVEKAA